MSYTTSDQKYLLTLFGLGVNVFFFTFSNNATMNWIFQKFQKYQNFLIDIICLLQLFKLLNCLVQLMRAHVDTSFHYANTTKSSIKNTKGWGATKQSISNNNTLCTFTFPSGKDVTMINCIQGPARHFFFFFYLQWHHPFYSKHLHLLSSLLFPWGRPPACAANRLLRLPFLNYLILIAHKLYNHT